MYHFYKIYLPDILTAAISRMKISFCGSLIYFQACLKIAFRQMCVTLCGRFGAYMSYSMLLKVSSVYFLAGRMTA